YNVKRATVAGGPYAYATVASGLTATSFLDTGLSDDVTYYYVVSGMNGVGEGPNSAEASATTNATPTVATAAAPSASPVTGTTTNLSVLGADDGGESN